MLTKLPQRQVRYRRRGQSLVEFALVSLVVYMILAAILTFGQLLYCGQGLQQAADLAARELTRTPLPAMDTFTLALSDSGVKTRVYNERYLVLTIDAAPGANGEVTYNGGHVIGDFPVVNQQLIPLMVYDQLAPPGSTVTIPVLRYPGAVFTDPNPDPNPSVPESGYLVRIPVLTYAAAPSAAQAEQVGWISALEEIPSSASANNGPGLFPISSPQQGVVALRFNYPYQSSSMSGYQPSSNPTAPPGPNAIPDPTNPTIPISDDGVTLSQQPSDVGAPILSAWQYGANSGTYGLGQQAAWAQTVMAYRRVISCQAIYRREVFQ